jgi:hypothetical protein
MTQTEKKISNLSMYFVYQKIREVDPSSVIMEEEIMMPVVGGGEGEKEDDEEVAIEKPKIKKLRGAERTLLTEDMEDVQLSDKKRTAATAAAATATTQPKKKKNK